MAGTANVGTTGAQDIDALLAGTRWTGVVTYSFPTSGSFYGTNYSRGENVNDFRAFNATQIAASLDAFGMFSAVSNITFQQGTFAGADLRLAESSIPPTAWAYYPGNSPESGDVWMGTTSTAYDTPTRGDWGWHTFIHEIGHAVGLKHGHETSGNGAMTTAHDSMEFTVMTYRSYAGAPSDFYRNETFGYAQTLMMYDIAALQHMYGVNYTTNAGNTVYRWSETTGEMFVNNVGEGAPGGNRVFLTVWDGGGNDTYNLSNYANAVTIDLRPGEWTTTSSVQLANLGDGKFARGNVANALLFDGDTRSLIENAVGGSGNDTLYGNTAGNVLNGGGGSDTAVFAGSQGSYTYSGTATSLRAAGFGATDTLQNIEFVRFLGSGQTVSTASLLDTTPPPRDDFRDAIGDTTAPLGTISAGGSRTGDIEAGDDVDLFKITLKAGEAYTFNLRGAPTGGGTLSDPFLDLLDRNGTVVASNDDIVQGVERDSRIVYTATAGGTYYLAAGSFETATGTYILTAEGGDDYRDTIRDSSAPLGSLSAGGPRTGRLESGGDRDVFKITLKAGQEYDFDLEGVPGGGGTLSDPVLRLLNSAGTEIAFNDDSTTSRDSHIDFTATAGGTYYLVAEGYQTAVGTYTLSAATAGERIVGTERADRLTGGAGDTIVALGGNDTIFLKGTPAKVVGGAGNDTVYIDVDITFPASSLSGIEIYRVRNGADADFSAAGGGVKVVSSSTAATGGSHLTGNASANKLHAGAGGDTLEGGAGSDRLYAGRGADRFEFGTGFGRDFVYGFKAGNGVADVLDVGGLFDNFADVMAHAKVYAGDSTLITLDGANKIFLMDVARSALRADDFDF